MTGNQKKARIIGGTVLALAVVVLFGITYAAFTQTLTINGTATAISTTWDVHFANLRPVENNEVKGLKVGTAKQLTAPSIGAYSGVNSTAIGTYSVSLTSPGDSIAYIFDVVNDGDYNVGISSVGTPANGNVITPTCQGTHEDSTQAATDAANVCSHLKYTLYYYDTTNNVATATPVSTYAGSSITFDSNDANGIAAGESKSMILKLEYVDWTVSGNENVAGAENDLPKANVTISNLGFNIVYNQIGNSTKVSQGS